MFIDFKTITIVNTCSKISSCVDECRNSSVLLKKKLYIYELTMLQTPAPGYNSSSNFLRHIATSDLKQVHDRPV